MLWGVFLFVDKSLRQKPVLITRLILGFVLLVSKTLNTQTSLLWHKNRKKYSDKVYVHDFNNSLCKLLQKGNEVFGNTDDMQKKLIKVFIGMFTVHIHFFAKLYCNFFERHIQWQHIIDVLWGQQLFLLQNFMNIDGTTLIFFPPTLVAGLQK